MKRLTFLPSNGNLLPETEQGKPEKMFRSVSLEVFFCAGRCESFSGTKAILCPPASGSQGVCLGVFFTLECVSFWMCALFDRCR